MMFLSHINVSLFLSLILSKIMENALAGAAQWIECGPSNQRVAGSIPSQGTCLGCGPGPQWEALERQPHIDVSLPQSLTFPLSKMNKLNLKKKPTV